MNPAGSETPAVLIARFGGDPATLRAAYDRAHALILRQPGPPIGELRHHCALGQDGLYVIGVWESEAHITARFADPGFDRLLRSVGFPPPSEAERTVLRLHLAEPPLNPASSPEQEEPMQEKCFVCGRREVRR